MFHYHAPLKFLSYPLVNERYQNNGIVRHFDYDSVITGTSMTENFKTSEAQKLFGSDFIKGRVLRRRIYGNRRQSQGGV